MRTRGSSQQEPWTGTGGASPALRPGGLERDGEAVKQSIAGVFDRASESYDGTGVEFFGLVGRTLVDLATRQDRVEPPLGSAYRL